MKRRACFEVGFVALSLLTACRLPMPVIAPEQCPDLVWSDEFDGAAVDSRRWELQIGDGCAQGTCGWGNDEEQYYRAENATVAGGVLTITAKKERVGDKAYTSARMRTLDHGDFHSGYFEARIRLPVGQGLWPAFWMLPTDEIYGGWPQSGEIDIMENIGSEPATVHGTLHYGRPWPDNRSTAGSYSLSSGRRFTDGFHTFAAEKSVDQIRWFVDGVLYSTKTPADTAPEPWPFNQRFHFILNVAVGGGWPGSPDQTTRFPQRMDVDYVRVYDAGLPYITGDAIVSHRQRGVVYSLGNVSGSTSVTWTVPSDATIVSGQGSSSITVDFAAASGDVTATFDECGSQLLARSVAVDPPIFLDYVLENFDDPENVTRGTITGTLNEVANPDTTGVNTSARSGEYTRNPGEPYDVLTYRTGLITDADAYVSRAKMFYLDLYTAAPAGTVLLLQLEDSSAATPSNYPSGRHSRYRFETSVQNAWERLEILYLDRPDPTVATTAVDTMVLLFEPNTSTGHTYYLDNLEGWATNTCVAPGDGAPCTATTDCCSGVGNCSGGRPSSRVCR